MIDAYRTIEIPLTLDNGTIDVRVPLTIDLLQRLEQTMEEAQKHSGWFRFKRRQGMIDAFIAFADPYLPQSVDRSKIQPAFYPLFFSLVRKELIHSLNDSIISMTSTEEPPEPTDAKTQDQASA